MLQLSQFLIVLWNFLTVSPLDILLHLFVVPSQLIEKMLFFTKLAIDYLQSGLSSLNSSNRQLILMTEQFNTSASELNQQLTNLSIACSTVCIACDCPSLQSIDTEVVSSMNSVSVLNYHNDTLH